MDKLIKLLNEYEYSMFEDKSLATQRWNIQDRIVFEKDFCKDLNKARDLIMNVTHLISHRYWFIKWLVNNNKIDLDMVREKLWIPCCVWYGSWRIIAVKDVEDYGQVLMLLAISDNPIKFLLSILKD